MKKEYRELPLDRYIELYTAVNTAKEFKEFEDNIIKQPAELISLKTGESLKLSWCIIDDDYWTGLAIHYLKTKNNDNLSEGYYYDDTFYSDAENGILQWTEIIISSLESC